MLLRAFFMLLIISVAIAITACGDREGHYAASGAWTQELVPPIQNATFSLSKIHLPEAPREYRDGTHQGFDFFNGSVGRPLAQDEPVVAVDAGEVVRIDHEYADPGDESLQFWASQATAAGLLGELALDKLRGRQVWIRHESGQISRYAHLSRVHPELQLGDTVEQGQPIGLIGNSGVPPTADQPEPAPHLHFELWSADGNHYLGEGLSALATHQRVAGIFGSEALPRYARRVVAGIANGESAPEPYPPEALPEVAFQVDPPASVSAGHAFAAPITWAGDDFAPGDFFALLQGQPLGIIDAGNGAWILGAMPLTIEAGELNLVVGASDPYGQTLAGNRTIERAGPGEIPAPREVSPEIFELHSDVNLERESRSLGAVVRQSMEINQALWDESFSAPVDGDVIQRFGQHIVQSMLRPAHPLPGVLVETEAGAQVVASNTGRVALVADLPIRGTTVAIVHGGGVVSVYGQLAEASIQVGDEVTRGQRIGSVGQTGAVSKPMLRWEMHTAGLASDPLIWIDQVLPGRADR
ncbi:MAG: peptidoglycan DD-metalloendopeptidase family protein [Wenzhouxiangellaceae bacterium]